ncbi:MAG TPA: DUF4340 domain-containing protein [Polyangiaceae bacterium]|nr:DUF4340 domain-containing protein [Polyangiaceae bacterium]
MRGRFWRRHGVTASLVALAFGLSLYAYLDRDSVTTAEREGRKGQIFSAFRAGDITRIGVRRGAESYALRRTPGARDAEGKTETRWQIESGGRVLDADPALADRFVSALEFASPERRLPSGGAGRAEAGLDAPRLVIEIAMGPLSPRLAVGGPAPRPEGASYAEAEGVLVVLRKETVTALDQPASAFFPRTLSPYLSTDLSRIELGGEGGERTLAREGPQALWRFVQGGDVRAARAAVDGLGHALAELRADEFLEPAEAERAQASAPIVRLTLVPREGPKPPARFLVGGACPSRPDDVVLRRLEPEPIGACVAKSVFDALAQGPEAWADRRAFFARDDEVEELVVEGASGRLELARKGQGWRERAPEEADLPRESVLALVKALTSAEGGELLPPGSHAASFEPPRGKVIVRTSGLGAGGPSETVEVGAPLEGGKVPLRRALDGRVIVVPPDVGASFGPRPLALRPRALLALAPESLRRLEAEGAIKQTLEKGADGHWRLVEPRGLPVDLAVAAEAASALARLEAERWIAESEAPEHGLSPPRLAVSFAAEGGPGPARHRLALGADAAGGLFARLDGGPVFVAPRSLVDALSSWAIDRSVFKLEAGELGSVTLKGERGELELAARDDRFEVARGPALSPARLSALREALQGLSAVAALHPGPPAAAEGLARPRLTITLRPKGQGAPLRIAVGAGDEYRGAAVHYARREGVDATYALPAARVRTLLDAL